MQHKIYNLNKTRTIGAEPVPNGVDILEEIIADEDYKLTQSADIPLQERIIASAVMLGKGCSSNEWREIPQYEADEILRQQEELRERETESPK